MHSSLIWVFGCWVAALSGCSSASSHGGGSASSATGKPSGTPEPELEQKPSGETGKPTDDTEGVPGYQLDLDGFEITSVSGTTTIKGTWESLGAPDGVAHAFVTLRGAPEATLDAARASDGVLVTEILGTTSAGPGGQFMLSTSRTDVALVVEVTESVALDDFVVPSSTERHAARFVKDGASMRLETLARDAEPAE